MKFRAKMHEIGSIQHLSKIVNSICRLTKNATLRITATHMYFIFSEQCGAGKVNFWCELPQAHYFTEYNIDGISPDRNEICIELTVDYLVTALRSANVAKSVKIKLAKKFSPCLTLEIELPSLVSHSRFVVHDVPVSIVPRKYWNEFQEPTMPEFDVSLYMPPLRIFRSIIDRMKNISPHLIINAGIDGRLTLKVESDTVNVSTYFEYLETTRRCEEESDKSTIGYAEIKIDVRRVSQFLYGQQINPERVICNIVHHQVIQFILVHDNVSIQFYLPNIAN